ncbi:MAG: ribosomal protein S18-alanine N-acetyltransferase [Flavobacteriales bacterium]
MCESSFPRRSPGRRSPPPSSPSRAGLARPECAGSGRISASHCTVLTQSGQQIIGFCILQTVLDEANLLLMAIDPQQQGQGYGNLLLEQSLERLGERCVMVFLEVRVSNQAAIGLYEKLGFHQVGTRLGYYPAPNGREDAQVMALTRDNIFG